MPERRGEALGAISDGLGAVDGLASVEGPGADDGDGTGEAEALQPASSATRAIPAWRRLDRDMGTAKCSGEPQDGGAPLSFDERYPP
jgi:hypothetical protein